MSHVDTARGQAVQVSLELMMSQTDAPPAQGQAK